MGRPQPSVREDYAAFQRITSRWNDIDVYGHMNNVVHYSLFDTAVNGWLMESGLLDPCRSDSIGLVVETGCRYFGEMGFPETVHAGLRVAHLGTSSVRFEIGLFRGEAASASAEGFFVHVYVDRDTRRPVPIAADRRAAFEGVMRG